MGHTRRLSPARDEDVVSQERRRARFAPDRLRVLYSLAEPTLKQAGDRMNGKTLMPAVTAALLVASWCLAAAPSTAQGPLLGDKHKTAGIECSACHKENPPKEIAPTAACLG